MDVENWFCTHVAGAAVGLGAIWKFPYVAGNGGGGAFFLVFFAVNIIYWYASFISGICHWT